MRQVTARTGKARPVGPSSVHESSANRIITQVEDALIGSGRFSLPKRREVTENDWVVVLLGATETRFERLKKQRRYYSGKRKDHTLKSQVLLEAKSQRIVSTAHAPGSTNDLTLFRRHDLHLQPHVWLVADGGYGGLAKNHPLSYLPVRKPHKGTLTPEGKAHNRALARFRVAVEHTIRSLKVWRIVKDTYRNRPKRFSLCFRLIAALVNANLDA